jgi:hypothetical protein
MSQPVYLGSTLNRTHWWGIVSDIATPALMTATMEMVGPDAAITMDVLKGDQGPKGDPADIVKMQWQDDFTDVAQIPVNTLTSELADIGKAWWIGNLVYQWTGTSLQAKAMGTAGPPGPVPNITPAINLLDPDGTTASSIVVSGDPANPGWLFNLKCPRGPQGLSGSLRGASDYDNTIAPDIADVITWNGTKYQPEPLSALLPRVYSIPEGAFNSFSGVASIQNIAHIAIPPQPWPWIPLVFGHIKSIGLELTTDPLTLGSAAFLGADGNAGGVLISRGFGNITSFANLSPHFSQPGATMTAVVPGNGIAVVPANHTGAQGDIYIDLWNEGALGAYSYNNKDSQALVFVMPVGV